MLTVALAYIPSIILSIAKELWLVVIFDTAAYIFMVFIFFAINLPVRIRAISILVIIYVLGMFLLIAVGPYGAGYLWIFILPILASIFTDTKTAIAIIIINFFSLMIVGLLQQYGIIHGYTKLDFSMSSWIVIVSNLTFLETILTISIIVIIKGLEKTFDKEKEIINSLEENSVELIRAKEESERANSLKSEFLAQMSHEIRTPINSILSSVSMLKDNMYDLTLDEKEEIFAIIHRGSNRVIRTIDSILNMSEIHTGSYEVQLEELFIMEDILYPIFSEFRHIALNKNISLEVNNIFGTDYKLFVDRYSATQIFANLIDNAIKYTHKGSVIINITHIHGFVYVDIIDTGIGISEEYQGDLFNPFSQEESGYSRRWEGNGLGLALVKRYCEFNNAKIYVESEKEKGSKFTVVFQHL